MEFTQDIDNFYSVSEITQEIKEILETSLPTMWIKGEISNFVHHNSGHFYFSLKDQDAQIACVMWKSRNTTASFYPQNGMQVFVLAFVRVYEKRGNYQLDCLKMLPAGTGALQMAFEELKARLFQQGLFDEAHKKRLPVMPQKIGIATSQTGAALQDILQILQRRFPAIQILLRPTLVQGEGAAKDIAQAIQDLNRQKDVDVIIVGRGGGSLEDLWAFNEEIVARAVYNSAIPIISAVGHEIDFTICDFVADLRAPTPSAAAELVVPNAADILSTIDFLLNKCRVAASNKVKNARQNLTHLEQSYAFRRVIDSIHQQQQFIDSLWNTIYAVSRHSIQLKKQQLTGLQEKFSSMHPDAILKRGFCILRKNGKIIKSVNTLQISDEIETQLIDGSVKSRIESKSI